MPDRDRQSTGRLERPRELLDGETLATPHLSGMGDRPGAEPGRQLVSGNLRRYVAGEPLVNVVDRIRGY